MQDLFEHFRSALRERAVGLAAAYQNAFPFPHVVLDDFLPVELAGRMLERFPPPDSPQFQQPDYETRQVGKLGRIQDSQFEGVDPWLRSALFEFNSLAFLDFLEALTGIRGLIPDPHFSGGAFHQILPGGKLDIHADFNVDERRLLIRRLNVLLYLNHNWRPEYGGNLELWDREMKVRAHSIAPVFNRCVIFSTSKDSYHGHPQPLVVPPGVTRKSIALYYYANDPTVLDRTKWHTTLWQDLPPEAG